MKKRGATNHFLLAGLGRHWRLSFICTAKKRASCHPPASVAATGGRVVGRVERRRRVPPWLVRFHGLWRPASAALGLGRLSVGVVV